MENNEKFEPILSELEKISESANKKIKWIEILSILVMVLFLAAHIIFDFGNLLYVIISGSFVMVMVILGFLILNKSTIKQIKIINEFKDNNYEKV